MTFKEKGLSAGNPFLESLNRKFSNKASNFVLGNAEVSRNYPIIYCSDGFCELTGFTRKEILGTSCDCELLYGIGTNYETIQDIKKALHSKSECRTEIQLQKKNGTSFQCLVDVTPIRNVDRKVVMFLVSHKEVVVKIGELDDIKITDYNNNNNNSSSKFRRKQSRDILFHLHERYNDSFNQDSITIHHEVGKSESQFIPEYKLEDSAIPRFMLLHFGRLRLIWDWIILSIVIYQAIAIPFQVAFFDKNNRQLYIVDVIIELMFVLDIVLNFRTTYIGQKSGKLITTPSTISLNYLKTWFVVDIIATFPFDLFYFLRNEWGETISFFKLIRLLRLFRIGRRVIKYIEYTTTLLLLMTVSFAMLSHWLACIWYVIGRIEEKGGWLYYLAEDKISFNSTIKATTTSREEYVSSLYFIFTSLTTVGFGNIAPNTVPEKIFSITILLLGAIVQSAIFGNMTAVIQKLYASRTKFHAKASQIKQFVRLHQIEGDLKRRIQDWFISHWSISKGVNSDEMLSSFPIELQSDICLHLYQSFLTLPCFTHASRGCLRSISVKVKKAHFSPGELIVKEKDAINSLFFVQRGTVEIVQGEFIVAILGFGDTFGEDICRSHGVTCANGDVKALMYCELLYLTKKSLKNVSKLYPDFPKLFSKNLVLSFDLSNKEISNRGPDLVSIEEENENVRTESSRSPSPSSPNSISDHNDSDSEKNPEKSSKEKTARKSLPLWQLKLTIPQSPSPSLKSRLTKLDNATSSRESITTCINEATDLSHYNLEQVFCANSACNGCRDNENIASSNISLHEETQFIDDIYTDMQCSGSSRNHQEYCSSICQESSDKVPGFPRQKSCLVHNSKTNEDASVFNPSNTFVCSQNDSNNFQSHPKKPVRETIFIEEIPAASIISNPSIIHSQNLNISDRFVQDSNSFLNALTMGKRDQKSSLHGTSLIKNCVAPYNNTDFSHENTNSVTQPILKDHYKKNNQHKKSDINNISIGYKYCINRRKSNRSRKKSRYASYAFDRACSPHRRHLQLSSKHRCKSLPIFESDQGPYFGKSVDSSELHTDKNHYFSADKNIFGNKHSNVNSTNISSHFKKVDSNNNNPDTNLLTSLFSNSHAENGINLQGSDTETGSYCYLNIDNDTSDASKLNLNTQQLGEITGVYNDVIEASGENHSHGDEVTFRECSPIRREIEDTALYINNDEIDTGGVDTLPFNNTEQSHLRIFTPQSCNSPNIVSYVNMKDEIATLRSEIKELKTGMASLTELVRMSLLKESEK